MKTLTPNQELWLDALRSGEYKISPEPGLTRFLNWIIVIL